jgi:5-methylcytosine-specific restriction endonuclease McrA
MAMKHCIDCGIEIKKQSERCKKCHFKKIKVSIRHCSICKQKLPKYGNGINCYSCSRKLISQERKIWECIDCGKIVPRRVKRCPDCNKKWLHDRHNGRYIRTSEHRVYMKTIQLGKPKPYQQGENHHNWKGGTSPERQRKYATADVRSFLRAVYKRDSYHCVYCGKPKTYPKSLHAHHIKSWAEYPELRYSINNVVTLCQSCHILIHQGKITV